MNKHLEDALDTLREHVGVLGQQIRAAVDERHRDEAAADGVTPSDFEQDVDDPDYKHAREYFIAGFESAADAVIQVIDDYLEE